MKGSKKKRREIPRLRNNDVEEWLVLIAKARQTDPDNHTD